MVEGALNEEETKAAQEKTKAKLEDRSAQLRRGVARFSYEYVLYELKIGIWARGFSWGMQASSDLFYFQLLLSVGQDTW